MKNQLALVLSVTIALSGIACSKSSSDHPVGTLQREFYRLPEKGGDLAFKADADTSTTSAVKNVFRIQSQAMDQVTLLPSDWVSWHLQGIIASFGLSIDGIFGALFSSGAASIKGTWVPKSSPLQQIEKKSIHSDLMISSRVRAADISQQLEPALRASVRSGVIKNESVFRKNALTQAERFRELCQAFSTARFANGWKVEQYRLELGFEADGKVAGTGVGAAAHLRFDWNAPDEHDEQGEPSAGSSSLGADSASLKRFRELIGVLSEEIRSATADAGDIESAGFGLDEVRIGIGISADGEIGVAHASASSMGSVTFSREESASISALSSQPESVTLIGLPQDSATAAYAANSGIDQQNGVYHIQRGSFRKGLVRAMKLGSWMTRLAAETPSTQWELSELEAEFDLSVSGTVGVTAVDGVGAVILGFARKGEK